MIKIEITNDFLKKCTIEAIGESLEYAANNNGINRETLRNKIIKKYPYIWKNKNNIRLKIILFKTNDDGIFEKNGFIFDLKYKTIIDKFKMYDNGNGYCRVGRKFYHRIITNARSHEIVDHINRNIKDNRICNLRICTSKQNSANKKIKGFTIADNGSGIKYFKSTVTNNYYKTKNDAINDSIDAHIKKYGEFSAYFTTDKD